MRTRRRPARCAFRGNGRMRKAGCTTTSTAITTPTPASISPPTRSAWTAGCAPMPMSMIRCGGWTRRGWLLALSSSAGNRATRSTNRWRTVARPNGTSYDHGTGRAARTQLSGKIPGSSMPRPWHECGEALRLWMRTATRWSCTTTFRSARPARPPITLEICAKLRESSMPPSILSDICEAVLWT